MFRELCAHHQVVKIVLYGIWYLHTCRWPSGAQVESGFSPLSTCAKIVKIIPICMVSKTSNLLKRYLRFENEVKVDFVELGHKN